MAGLATSGTAIGPLLRHTFPELTVVRILVAPGAGAVFKSVRYYLCCVPGFIHRMALRAGDGQVRADERIPALLMLRDRVRRGLEPTDDVAGFTFTLVWSSDKLPLVHICVAIHTFRKSNLVSSRCARREVAFRAGNSHVFAGEWISRRSMRLTVEQ
jgi:hypothetical protein